MDDGGSDVDGFYDVSDVVMFVFDVSDVECGFGMVMMMWECMMTWARGSS